MVRRHIFPACRSIEARLDDSPAYEGSVHDADIARRMGFRAALVPGAFVYGYASRLAVEVWGMDWISSGAIGARFRRPVYDGDRLTLTTGPLVESEGVRRAEVGIANADGDTVFTGWIGLPRSLPAPPPLADLPVRAPADPPPAVAPGTLRPGLRIGSRWRVLSEEDIARSRQAFGEDHPTYAAEGIAHSGCLIRLAMADTNRSFAFPAPAIFTAATAQHFAPVRAGARIATSGVVTAAYERRGRYYFESEEHLLDGCGTVLARFNRTSIYAESDA